MLLINSNEYGFIYTSTTEQTNFTTFAYVVNEVNDFDACV